MKLVHVITDTDTGGAEMMLEKLVAALERENARQSRQAGGPLEEPIEQRVISLLPVDTVGRRIRESGVPVESPGLRPGFPGPAALLRLAGLLRAERPAVLQTWMYHADLLGGLAGRLFAGMPVLWNIRQSNLDPAVNTSSTMRSAALCRRLSRKVPQVIVCGSEAARRTHTEFGYDESRMVVLPNGFDLEKFYPDREEGRVLRRELGIPDGAPVIGLMARFDPQKDHATFIRAARHLTASVSAGAGSVGRRSSPAATAPRFVLCGEEVVWENPRIRELIGEGPEGPFGGLFHLLGRRHDLRRLYNAFDIGGTSSLGEGFPNVVGEAMACAVPCVVTDVGDSALIVAETGLVVPPRDPEALAAAWRRLIERGTEERERLGAAARSRIEAHYGIETVARRYAELYRGLWNRSFAQCAE